jgi:CTD small phosphatase-like protein 2
MPEIDMTAVEEKTVSLPVLPKLKGRKTVIFDMDETLIHCCGDPNKGKIKLDITTPEGLKAVTSINVRPHAIECLREAAKIYEVIVFTASVQSYADAVLNYLDPTGELIHHRLYRHNCIWTNGVYIKDLRILQNRTLENIVIVDNNALSFA